MKGILKKIFGGLNITWPKLIIFSIIMGIYTALMAMWAPDGTSFHDIAVTAEWWVLPAIIIIVNCKKPLEAALKTFVFFLISQPLVYLVQVPFNSMGWSLFGYYGYWFNITLLTFPAAFVAWFIKKDKWYSGIILSGATALLILIGYNYALRLTENFPNHLISIIYCFGIIPVFIFGIFKDKIPRIATASISAAVLIALCIVVVNIEKFEVYNNAFVEDNSITFVGEPYVSGYSGDSNGEVKLRKTDDGMYVLTLKGAKGQKYSLSISDDKNEYDFVYYYDKDKNAVLLEKQ